VDAPSESRARLKQEISEDAVRVLCAGRRARGQEMRASFKTASRGRREMANEQQATVTSGDDVRTGVQALAAEIDERLPSQAHAKTADLRGLRREFSRRLKDAAPHVVIEIANLLLEIPRIEHRFVAYELIHHHPGALSHLNAWQLEQLGRGISSWGAVDCFGVYLAGPVWRTRHVPNSLIHAWARSADRWWRRAALVSTVPLNSKSQGGTGDASRTLQVCRLLERDHDPMVVKALSWALRALAKRDPRAVREYVASREDVLPALVLREVKNKLQTGLKNPRKR
jgi:3-methyladenine DNA glycosylase AlkD